MSGGRNKLYDGSHTSQALNIPLGRTRHETAEK